jgi:hypothetical protein
MNEDEKMKKKTILTGFAVIILGIIVVMVGLTSQQQVTEGISVSDLPSIPETTGASGPYVLATTYPVVNDTYPVYKTIPPDFTDERVNRLRNLFGFSPNAQAGTSNEDVQVADGSKNPGSHLTIYKNSGAFMYNIPEKYFPYSTDVQPDLPSDEEARAIATKYLLERDLLPDDVQFKEVSIGSQYEHKTMTSYALYNLTKRVRFVKEIHGIPVCNAGIGVSIGDKGEVVMATSSLREFYPEPVRFVKVLTPEQAYQRLLSNDLMIMPLGGGYDEILITNVTLGYWMEIQIYPQKYIMPVYAFSCVTGRGDETEQVMRYVWAVEPSEM